MGNNRIYLADWSIDGDRVKLVYSDEDIIYVKKVDFDNRTKCSVKIDLLYIDEDIIYVKKVDFDRAFGAIVNAEKHEIVRDFAIKDGEE